MVRFIQTVAAGIKMSGAAVIGASLALAMPLAASAADKATDFALRDIDSHDVTLSQYKGQVVVMQFWATWCGPCKVEMPHLQKMYTELKDQGMVVLSVSTDDARTASQVKPFVKKMKYTFPVLLDKESTVVGAYNPSKTLPYLVIIDRNGDVVQRHSGYNPGDEVHVHEEVVAALGAHK
jgi:peroxiredoxin